MSQAASPVSQAFAPQDLGLFARMVAVPAIWGLTFLAGRWWPRPCRPRWVPRCATWPPRWPCCWPPAAGRRPAPPEPSAGHRHLPAGGHRHLAVQPAVLWRLAHLPGQPHLAAGGLLPTVTIATSRFVLGDPVSPRWLGVALALLGVWTVITRSHLLSALSQSVGIGELLMFGGVLAWMAYTLIGRVALKGPDAPGRHHLCLAVGHGPLDAEHGP